jgi:hypothetical protein
MDCPPRPIQTNPGTSGPKKTWGGLTGFSEPPQLEEPRKDVSVSSCDTKTSSGAENKGYPPELE